jgi:hypothetical protein|tara:strand:- start:2523 stop:2747 length:225 start_codon:yes stop_codon:yes gene_type:complete
MNDSPKLILLSDIIESKVRKERELDFYQKELEKLQEKMYWLRREIGLNETIIDIIKKDNIIDFKEQMEKKLLEE